MACIRWHTGWCDHNCPNQPQLSQKTTIVVTTTTIVAILIYHNCRNTNHKCHNFFWKKYCVFIINSIQNYDIQYNFQQSLLHLSQLNHDKLWNTMIHHKTILQLLQFWYWNFDNCEIFKISAVTYYEKITTF